MVRVGGAKPLNTNGIELKACIVVGVCDNESVTARKSLILNGEMLERSIRHAWKAVLASIPKRHRNTSLRIRSNGLR
jgi:hypothetical protein